ncbi:MAG: fatty acid desaturase [Nitrospirota bacterium]
MGRHLNAGVEDDPRTLDIPTIGLFALVTLAALIGVPVFGYTHGYTKLDWTMAGIQYLISGLGITVGYHRMISHRSFRCPDWIKVAFLVAGSWAMENSALKWSANHARHHGRVDQDEDPYNARRGFWYSHCGWLFTKRSHRIERYAPGLRKDSVVMWQHRWYVPLLLSGLALPFLVGYAYNGWIGGVGCFMLAGIGRIFLVLNSTFCINSVCHLWGSQPYSRSNSSRDSWWVSLLTLGEGYHNYHHTFPRDYRNGYRWYNVDPSKWLIYTLSRVGLAEGLVRCNSDKRARIGPRTSMPDGLGDITGNACQLAGEGLEARGREPCLAQEGS